MERGEPARDPKKSFFLGKRQKTLETKQNNSKSYEHYKEESAATAPWQHLSIMLGANDLNGKMVAL